MRRTMMSVMVLYCGVLLSGCESKKEEQIAITVHQWPEVMKKVDVVYGFRMGEPWHAAYLGLGWDLLEQDEAGRYFRWAIGDTVDIKIPISAPCEMTCELLWSRPPLGPGQVQGAIFLLNGREIYRTAITSHRFTLQTVRLPETGMKTGWNLLQIVPSHRASVEGDPRALRFAMREISWHRTGKLQEKRRNLPSMLLMREAKSQETQPGLEILTSRQILSVDIFIPASSIISGRFSYFGEHEEEHMDVSLVGSGEDHEVVLWNGAVGRENSPLEMTARTSHSLNGFIVRFDGQEGSGLGVSNLTVKVPPLPRHGEHLILLSLDGLRADMVHRLVSRNSFISDLMASSTVFTQAMTPSTTLQSVYGSIFTGTYPHVHNVMDEEHSISTYPMTLASLLKDAGFACMAVVSNPGLEKAQSQIGKGFNLLRGPTNHSPTAAGVSEAAVQLIFSHWREMERSLFWVQFSDLLADQRPPEQYLETYGDHGWSDAPETSALQGLYVANMAYIEESVRRIADAHAAIFPEASPTIVLTSAMGRDFGENVGLEVPQQLLKEIIHIPLVLSIPGIAAPSAGISDPVSPIDILPTVAELLGLSLEGAIQGRSLLPVLTGGLDNREAVYCEGSYDHGVAVLEWPHKLIMDTDLTCNELENIENVYLYNLHDDPEEEVDLSGDKHSLIEAMFTRWRNLVESTEMRYRPVPIRD